MNLEILFSIANFTAISGWIMLIFFPNKTATHRLVHSGVLSLILAVAYSALLFPIFFTSAGGFSTLAAVKQLFENDQLLLAGWVHYLAFDLFIGSWIVRKGLILGLSHWLVIPCLILTFLFGPFGLLLYFIIRKVNRPL